MSFGARRGVILGGLVFAFVHVLGIQAATFEQGLPLALIGFAARVPIGIALGWLFVRKGTLWAPIGLHAAFNAILLIFAELYAQSWYDHVDDEVRLDAPGAKPRVGCTMLIAIAEDESEALDVATRGMNGLVRRTHAVHRWDVDLLGEEAADAALGPLRKILGSIDAAIQFGAGTAEQIRDRFAEILAEGNTDYLVLQIPTGDMSFDEAKRTLDIFATKVKPDLELA